MKKLHALTLTIGLLASTVIVPTASLAKSDDLPYLNEIKKMQPDVSTQELISSINELANNTGNTKEAVSEQIYKELKADEEQGKKRSK